MSSLLPALAFAAVITAQFASVTAARALNGPAHRGPVRAMSAAAADAEQRT
jgi:hypothetical protein